MMLIVNAHLLIDAVVQQTMVLIAALATAGGVRAPLTHIANQVFLDLTSELQGRGVKKKVIADMFGMALRTYHRRVREAGESQTEKGKSVWEAVLTHVRQQEPVTGRSILSRFSGDDPDVVAGVLNDLTQSGLIYRSGRGDGARYRAADERDFSIDEGERKAAYEYLVWLAVYRSSPATLETVLSFSRVGKAAAEAALADLAESGRVTRHEAGERVWYTAKQFDVQLGATQGWEAAVLDHFQALVASIVSRLTQPSSAAGARASGSTWSLDVWPGHPFEAEATGLLAAVRTKVEDLRCRIDVHNEGVEIAEGESKRVVFYAGQHVVSTCAGADGGREES